VGVRSAGAAALMIALAVAVSGCGTRSPASSSSGPPTGVTATTGTSTSAGTGTSSTTTSAATTGGGAKHRRSGASTPPAPDGLAATTGYGTYERCAGTCRGSIPASLRRPLKLPNDDGGPCPATFTEHGPVAPTEMPAGVGFRSVSGSSWMQAPVTWASEGTYTGPVLIRGAQVGGSAAPIGFGQGVTPYDELQLLDAGMGAPAIVRGGRAWVTVARITAPGCYAYQVDGTSFSEVIVFRAVG
jgi:hypothetical protein